MTPGKTKAIHEEAKGTSVQHVETLNNVKPKATERPTLRDPFGNEVADKGPNGPSAEGGGYQRHRQKASMLHKPACLHAAPNPIDKAGNTDGPDQRPRGGRHRRLPQQDQQPCWNRNSLKKMNKSSTTERGNMASSVGVQPPTPLIVFFLALLSAERHSSKPRGGNSDTGTWGQQRRIGSRSWGATGASEIQNFSQCLRNTGAHTTGWDNWRCRAEQSITVTCRSPDDSEQPRGKSSTLSAWVQALPYGLHRWGASHTSFAMVKSNTGGRACSRSSRKAMEPPSVPQLCSRAWTKSVRRWCQACVASFWASVGAVTALPH